jgi:hypothetical protein
MHTKLMHTGLMHTGLMHNGFHILGLSAGHVPRPAASACGHTTAPHARH